MKKIKLKRYSDNRGYLVENTDKTIVCDSQHFFISKSNPGVIRGNHYHKRKNEWFYLIQGKCKLITKNVKSGIKKSIIIEEKNDIAVNIKPFVAHAFINIGNKEMVIFALVNEQHNQNDPDTYDYILI